MSGLNWGGTEDGPSPMDDKLAVRFFMQPIQDELQSIEAGRPVFRDVEYIEIGIPGDKLLIQIHPVTAEDRRRFPREWAAFGQDAAGGGSIGTPLTEWGGITRSQAEELAYFRVRTVEQLASLADANALNLGPIQALKRRAQDFIEKAKSDAPFEKLRAEKAEADERLAALESQLHKQAAAIARLTGSLPPEAEPEQKKRRGRPPKKKEVLS